MRRRDRCAAPRLAPQLGRPDHALRAPRDESAPDAVDASTLEPAHAPAPQDYFPLAPMTAIAMLWWMVAGAAFSDVGVALTSIVAMTVAWSVYRWLCGSVQRATLLSVGLSLAFVLVWWRASEFKPIGLGTYSAVLLLLWLVLKFGGRIHARVREDTDVEPHRVSSLRNWWFEDSNLEYVPIYYRPTSTVEAIWTTVSTVFQLRYAVPRIPSRSFRTRRCQL